MANPTILQDDTRLYCAAEPKGRVFSAGEPWPGDAWSPNAGGEPVGKGATAQAMKDLIEAQDKIDNLSDQLASAEHDKAQLAAQREEAVAAVADLEQRALAAEQGQTAADERVRAMMAERDAARADFQRVSDQFAEANARLAAAEPAAAKVAGLTEQLEAANQTIADLNDKIAEQAKAAKPAKAAKTADPAPDAPDTSADPKAAPDAT